MLLAEPSGHVCAEDFARSELLAVQAGLAAGSRPVIRSSHTVLLIKRE